jgi:hypothetical protein
MKTKRTCLIDGCQEQHYATDLCSKHYRQKYERETPRRHQRDRLKFRYGVTPEQVAAVAEEQNHRCAICRERPDKLVIDHCHTTGKFRALLCGQCNSALGLLAENPEILKAAILYVETWQTKIASST